MIVTRQCPFCSSENEITVDADQWAEFQRGASLGLSAATHGIQVLFPELNADDREMLMTGICPPCWDRVVGGE